MKTAIIEDIDQTTAELLQAVGRFTDKQFNQIPFEGSWTAGQVAEHVFKAESGIPILWAGSTREADRPIDLYANGLRNQFMDFSTKMKSPDFILPSDDPKVKDQLYHQLKENRAQIRSVAENANLELLFTGFELPGLGVLTGIEWSAFFLAHSRRHIYQLNNIYAAISA